MRLPLHTRYSDYDSKGHVNNAAYLTFFEIARGALWVDALGESPDFPFVVAAAQVRYVTPARLGEPLDVEVGRGEVRTRAWVWRYRVRERATGRLVAEGETTQVMYDYAAGASVEIPDRLRARLAALPPAADA
jgi:acyl-CoA thioester hydrolase